MFRLDTTALKEPRGFIRLLQIIFAICAFSVTCNFSSETSLTVNCGNDTKIWKVPVRYPFDQTLEKFYIPSNCTHSNPATNIWVHVMPCGARGSASFFVAVGVASLLACVVAVPFYILKSDLYDNNSLFPFLDLCCSAVLTFLWFVSWCAWTSAVSDIKTLVSPDRLAEFIPNCSTGNVCSNSQSASYKNLTISSLLGVINIMLWVGSCWFVYKDTRLHQGSSPAAAEGAPSSSYADNNQFGGGSSAQSGAPATLNLSNNP